MIQSALVCLRLLLRADSAVRRVDIRRGTFESVRHGCALMSGGKLRLQESIDEKDIFGVCASR